MIFLNISSQKSQLLMIQKIYFTLKTDDVFNTKIISNNYIIAIRFIMRFLYLRIVDLIWLGYYEIEITEAHQKSNENI